MAALVSFLAGALMGLGLAVSGMINPAKVLNFLDIAGHWDPTLAAVMAAALATAALGYRLVFRRRGPLFAPAFALPTRRAIDAPLIAGAALFGLGWGLAGFCPGPAIAALTSLRIEPFVFVAAMAVGMAVTRQMARPRRPGAPDSAQTSP